MRKGIYHPPKAAANWSRAADDVEIVAKLVTIIPKSTMPLTAHCPLDHGLQSVLDNLFDFPMAFLSWLTSQTFRWHHLPWNTREERGLALSEKMSFYMSFFCACAYWSLWRHTWCRQLHRLCTRVTHCGWSAYCGLKITVGWVGVSFQTPISSSAECF